MLSKILAFLGDPADVRSVAAIVAGVLITILNPAHSALVTAVVDGVAGLVVTIDVATTSRSGATTPAGANRTVLIGGTGAGASALAAAATRQAASGVTTS